MGKIKLTAEEHSASHWIELYKSNTALSWVQKRKLVAALLRTSRNLCERPNDLARRRSLYHMANVYYAHRRRSILARGITVDEWASKPETDYPLGSPERVCASANALGAAVLRASTEQMDPEAIGSCRSQLREAAIAECDAFYGARLGAVLAVTG